MNDSGDEFLGEMEIGDHIVRKSKKGEVLIGEDGELKKKKKKKKSRKERDEYLRRGRIVENEGSDTYIGEIDIERSDKDEEGGELILDHGVGLKAETKKRKKESSSNGWKDGKKESAQDLGAHGKILNVDVIEKIDKKKMKLKKGQSKKDMGIPDAICAGEDMEKEARKKRRKKEKKVDDLDKEARTKNRKKEKTVDDLDKEARKKTRKKEKTVDDLDKEARKKTRKKEKTVDDLDKEARKKKREKEKTVDDMDKEARKKKRKREKEKTLDDSTGAVVTGENLEKQLLEEGVRRKKRKSGDGKNNEVANHLLSCEGSSTIEMETKDSEIAINNKGKEKQINQSENTKAKKGKKKVSFSGQVEIFPVSSDSSKQERKDEKDNMVRGKRFSAEEDKIVQEAVYNYIEERNLGEKGLDMVLNCGAHPEVKGCWNHIAKAVPYRPRDAVYYRSHILFKRGDKRKWSVEDCELLKKLHEQHGNQWKIMAEEFGRHRWHVKDAWRRLKFFNRNKGHWSQKEYQDLFDLVNTDLRLKIREDEEKKQKYGMLRDNIHWTAISDTMTTRTGPNCCMKWYHQLASPMVAQGIWADSDDYRLIDSLFTLDASCIEDVDWDNLIDHRSGDLCRDRWNKMVLHVGNHVTKSFSEQVEILTRRYCPDLVEVREAWDNKSVVD